MSGIEYGSAPASSVPLRSTYIPWRAAKVRQRYPAGHFHSPIPDLRDVAARRSQLFNRTIYPGEIDLHEDTQWQLLEKLGTALDGFPWGELGVKGGRYRFRQEMFGRDEAVVLAALLLTERPRRFVDVGSGWVQTASPLTSETSHLAT